MRLIRFLLRWIILTLDRLTAPRPIPRSPENQAKIDLTSSALTLYQFEACPFCVKVRREIRRLGLKVAIKDAKTPGPDRDTLIREGGQLQTPCLRIPGAQKDRWLYESDDIIEYLRATFPA